MSVQVNETLVREVVEKLIEQAPHGGWDQRQFVNECGSSFCFAGWALRLSGYGIGTEDGGRYFARSWFIRPDGTPMRDQYGYSDTGAVARAACAVLGIDWDKQGYALFFNFTSDLEKMIEHVEYVTELDLSAEKEKIK